MSLLTAGSLIIYTSWRAANAYQSYKYNKGITFGNIWEILFSLLMCYWLIIPSSLFLFAKIVDGLFALGLGIYLNMLVGPDRFLAQRNKVVNGYWSYAIMDTIVCIVCFGMSVIGSING
jgi:hypothetical protein